MSDDGESISAVVSHGMIDDKLYEEMFSNTSRFATNYTLRWVGIIGAVGKACLTSDHKVPSLIPSLPRFEYLCDFLFRLS